MVLNKFLKCIGISEDSFTLLILYFGLIKKIVVKTLIKFTEHFLHQIFIKPQLFVIWDIYF